MSKVVLVDAWPKTLETAAVVNAVSVIDTEANQWRSSWKQPFHSGATRCSSLRNGFESRTVPVEAGKTRSFVSSLSYLSYCRNDAAEKKDYDSTTDTSSKYSVPFLSISSINSRRPKLLLPQSLLKPAKPASEANEFLKASLH